MKRVHRSVHRVVWLLVALGVGIGLLLALLWREPAHAAAAQLAIGLGP